MASEIDLVDSGNSLHLEATNLSFKDASTYPACAVALPGVYLGTGASSPQLTVGSAGLVRSEVSSHENIDYTLVLADAGRIIEMTSGDSHTPTVPPGTGGGAVAFPIGTRVDVVRFGTGSVQILGASGVNIRTNHGAYLAGRYAVASLYKHSDTEWVLVGDLSAS